LPVFREGETPPAWCELESFSIADPVAGAISQERRRAGKERVLVTRGSAQVHINGGSQVLRDGQFLDLPVVDTWTIIAGARGAQFVRLSGRWSSELGGCGIFQAQNVNAPVDLGDPVTYAKTTSIDSHYHDCDEYWIVLEGAGTVVVGDRHIRVAAGDCVPIGMGHHHDLPLVVEPLKAVYFETTLQREKRVGHLWNHTHGRAHPAPERI
jgi:mannose-6-phosphate isomerase-like protein (cupin superfamily)